MKKTLAKVLSKIYFIYRTSSPALIYKQCRDKKTKVRVLFESYRIGLPSKNYPERGDDNTVTANPKMQAFEKCQESN